MNIWQIIVIAGLVYIGGYTLFLIMKTMIELSDYIGEYKEITDTDKSTTWRAFVATVAFLMLMVISFCPIFNILLCLALVYVEYNKKVVFENYKEKYINSKNNLE